MEELVLTDPVVVPSKTTAKYRVIAIQLNLELAVMPNGEPGFINIDLKNEHGEPFTHQYHGKPAVDMIKFLNTANLTTKSMHKRILERLSNDGVLPGSVTGAPDPPVAGE